MAHNLRVRCEEKAVSSAHLPGRIIGRGLLTEAVVVDVIVGKMGDHLPLYRQVERMKRACGFHPGLSTLSDVTMEVGSMLWLAVDAQKKNLLEGAYIQADEARMPVQTLGCRAEITRRSSGNTAGRMARWCSSSGWDGSLPGRRICCATTKARGRVSAAAPCQASVAQVRPLRASVVVAPDGDERGSVQSGDCEVACNCRVEKSADSEGCQNLVKNLHEEQSCHKARFRTAEQQH